MALQAGQRQQYDRYGRNEKLFAAILHWHGPRGSFAAIAALLVAPMEPPLRLRASSACRKILRDHPPPLVKYPG